MICNVCNKKVENTTEVVRNAPLGVDRIKVCQECCNKFIQLAFVKDDLEAGKLLRLAAIIQINK
jgi:hypothetical protein